MRKTAFPTYVIPELLIPVVAVGMIVLNMYDTDRDDALSDISISSQEPIVIDGLVDHLDRPLTRSRLTNNWSFVFFGFTNCPDVCPLTLNQLVAVNRAIKKRTDIEKYPTFYFVSVDPERDTKPRLAEYVGYFDSSFVGLTGEIEKLIKFEKQFDAYHRYGRKNSAGNYTVQHSAEVYLINPAGNLIAKFTPPLDINTMVEQFATLVKRFNQAAV